MLDRYVYKNQKKLRCGYTTGSCAAAATKAAVEMLLGNTVVEVVELTTPSGIKLELDVEKVHKDSEKVMCAIRKDSGDDPDITDGIFVFSGVRRIKSEIVIDGGEGVGRVTKLGLDQPIGEAAINSVPRTMIRESVEEICNKYSYIGGIEVIISIPEGETIAQKTFNPRLGIEGGISILGTTGIVEPMSEQALLDTIEIEMRQQIEEGNKKLVITPGNYGAEFIKENLDIDLDKCVKCSNYIGDSIDKAVELGFDSLLLIGHIGKLVKLGSGVMNTHSKYADGRMETIASSVILAGGSSELARKVLEANTTEEAVSILDKEKYLSKTMDVLIDKIYYHLSHRAGDNMKIDVIVFSTNKGLLGNTQHISKLKNIQG